MSFYAGVEFVSLVIENNTVVYVVYLPGEEPTNHPTIAAAKAYIDAHKQRKSKHGS